MLYIKFQIYIKYHWFYVFVKDKDKHFFFALFIENYFQQFKFSY